MRQKFNALALIIALFSLAGCALPQGVVMPTPAAPPSVAVPAGPGGLSVAPVPCPTAGPYLFCVGVLP
jgi:hypothetical protein